MFTTFAYALAGGMLVVLAFTPVTRIAWRFLRLACMLSLALTAVVTAWAFREAGWGMAALGGWPVRAAVASGVAAALATFIAPFAQVRPAAFRVISLAGGLAGMAAACMLTRTTVIHRGDPQIVVPALVGQVLGGLLLGSITVAWLLGHAYLTATKMTIVPLRHAALMLSLFAWLRLLFLPVSALLVWGCGILPGDELVRLARSNWLILSLRVGVGLIAVVLFAHMVADCVRLRSTQSATGILYFGSVFAYIGELASLDLLNEIGWPL